jgi:CSLREA domain-containing protein
MRWSYFTILLVVSYGLFHSSVLPQGSVAFVSRMTTPTITRDDCPTSNTLTVNTTDDLDNGACLAAHCSLREAINAANCNPDATAINFDSGVFAAPGSHTISLASALPIVVTDININGPGANVLTVQRSTAGGTPGFRILDVEGGTVAISSLTLSNGDVSSGFPISEANSGGAIFNRGNLNLRDCTVSGSRAAFGGGIYNTTGGMLTLTNCTVSGNRDQGSGGGIHNRGTLALSNSTVSGNTGSLFGGGISNETGATLTMTNSTISGNTTFGMGVAGGGIFNRGTLTLTNGTVNDNIAQDQGSITGSQGGGIYNLGTLTLVNATISGNVVSGPTSAGAGGGVFNVATLTLTNSTVSGNSAPNGGGGLFNDGSAGVITNLKNTIVANNTISSGTGPDLKGTFNSQDFNLIGNTSGATFTGTTGHNITNMDPLLGPLANNGGLTMTRALLPGSPAINAGSNANLPLDTFDLDGDGNTSEPLPVDQRGVPRIANTTVDIGAFEFTDAPGGVVSFSQSNYFMNEGNGFLTVTVNRTGDTTSAVTVDYATDDTGSATACSTFNGFASSHCDFTTALGTLRFAANDTQKSFVVLVSRDSYTENPNEVFKVTLSNLTVGAILATPASATVMITDAGSPAPNAIDDTDTFVRQHYHDFLNREADLAGLNFWKNEITSCGSDANCIEVKRINVSAAFFLSIEFQHTGFLVERIYKAAYGDVNGDSTFGGAHQLRVPVVRFLEFLSDSQQISRGVVVLQPGWEMVLENNKIAFAADFVQRERFSSAYPTTLTPTEFVDLLFANAQVMPSAADRNMAIGEFGSATVTTDLAARARALRRVAENATLVQQEFNRAFVLMQYFGYLRRNPNDPQDTDYSGYDFWLTKLNQSGNFQNAELVKAFMSSIEYRQRFGP